MRKQQTAGQKAHNINRGERYAMVPAKVIKSQAFLSLTASAYRLLMLALIQYSGRNNGDIALTKSTLKNYGFKYSDTLARAKRELLKKGLLILTRQGSKFSGLGSGRNGSRLTSRRASKS